jgi:hypothetical protein
MTLGACGLEDRLVVPVKAEPPKSIEDGVDCGRRRARAVGVLDPQKKATVPVT